MTAAPKSFRQTIGLAPSTIDLSLQNSALVVIDAQGTCTSSTELSATARLTGVIDAPGGGLEITDSAKSLAAMAEAVSVYRKAGAPVVWVQHSAGAGAPIFNPDNESYDFISDLRPASGEKSIVKGAPSSYVYPSYYSTSLLPSCRGLCVEIELSEVRFRCGVLGRNHRCGLTNRFSKLTATPRPFYSFTGTDLDATLKQHNIKQIVLTGYMVRCLPTLPSHPAHCSALL